MASNMGTTRLPPVRFLQTVGITSAAILGSMSLTNSFFTIPAILLSPTPLALRQWAQMYNLGKAVGPSFSLVSFISFTYLAYYNYSTYSTPTIVYSPFASMWKGYLLAGTLVISIIPYTLATMERSVNTKLMEEAEKAQAHGAKAEARKIMGLKEENDGISMSAATVKQLLDEWATLNLGRSLLGLSAAVAGLWTALA